MALHTPCLQIFIESVPTCSETASLAAALSALKQPKTTAATLPTRLVLLDEHQHAIGWVSSQHLLHHLMVSGLLRQPSADLLWGDRSDLKVANQPLLAIAPSLVAPLIVLSGALPIDQFLPYLYDEPHACYALASPEGTFLGLLDSTRLLQFLTEQEAALTAIQAKTPPNSQAECSPLPLNPLLLKLLERLPLPVMLQTRDGRVLAQNVLWRAQIDELLDPAWLRQEVAALLEMPVTEGEAVLPQPQHGSESVWEQSILGVQDTLQAMRSLTPLVATQSRAEAVPISEADYHPSSYREAAPFEPGVPSASACYLGSKPGSCVCVCPLKDGQEQVLQFVRIPIGTVSSHMPSINGLDLGDHVASMTTAAPSGKAPFVDDPAAVFPFLRLATLVDPVLRTQSSVEPMSVEAANPDTPLSASIYLAKGDVAGGEAIAASEELWLILAQDITEQQQLARELTAKNADLIQLNRLKDEFLACVSHELRTPLTAMLGLSSLLKDQTIGTLNQRQVHYAQLIYQSGRQLMAVVNDILDLTRIETGQLELVVEPVEIASVCQRAFEQAQQLWLQEMDQSTAEPTAEEASFTLELEPGLGLLVADEQRLRQMLVHLLSNALKFTELKAPIGLKVGHWGGWIAFTVWDTGIGIAAEKQHLIFQKFQQLENPLTRRFEGTGLGLVLTQRLARLHGGDVTFISKEGQGSQFTILLPPNPPGIESGYIPHRESIEPSAPNAPLGSTNGYALKAPAFQPNQLVLIVEAVPHFIEMLSDQLAGLGHQVAIARSGTEALEKARRLQPCIIFLNPVLPLLSGWDVLTLLKSSAETCRIPVAVMATQVDEEQSRQRQADSLLSLPVQPQALQKCLQQLVIKLDAAKPKQPAVLTVLRLTPGIWSHHHQPIPTADLNVLLHSRQYRVLEADDLEQAELLARVWKPNVVLLDGILVDEIAYFQKYRQHIVLASLPLVTIDQANTQAANQVPGLLVFPYLSTLEAQLSTGQDTETSALLQVIQVAAGYACRPSILAIDAVTLPMSLAAIDPQNPSETILGRTPETEWLQALMQYLNVAGLRGLVGRCWQEVLQQIESRSVDMLLICWTEATPQSFTTEMLATLQQSQRRLPIVVLDHRRQEQTAAAAIAPLPAALSQIAATVLPASLSMSELLTQIHQVIRVAKR